jgi:hypothetical protein
MIERETREREREMISTDMSTMVISLSFRTIEFDSIFISISIKMDQYEVKKSTSNIDIDQLCRLIDENTIGLKINSSSKLSSIPSYQLKSFNSTRLKRLNSPSIITKSNSDEHDNCSSLVTRFRSLSTTNIIQSQRDSKPIINEEENNSTNMEELTAYFDDLLYLPKSLSTAAELMYT